MQIVHLLSVFALLLFLIGCGPDFDDVIDVNQLVSSGWAKYEAGEFDEALNLFNQAILADNQNSEAQIGIGWSFFGKQKAQSAINEFEKALILKSDATDAYVGLSGAYLAVENYKSAIENAQEALNQQPDYIFEHNPLITKRNLHLVIAKGYYFLGSLEKSLDSIHTIDESIEIEKSDLESELPKVLEKLTRSLAQNMYGE
jgi:tetratricopeptide (TPR) repeat protein